MNIQIEKFGDVLISRPAGREAFLMTKAYLTKDLDSSETIFLDFANVKVLTPSWIGEYINSIKSDYKNNLVFLNTANETVSASLRTVLS